MVPFVVCQSLFPWNIWPANSLTQLHLPSTFLKNRHSLQTLLVDHRRTKIWKHTFTFTNLDYCGSWYQFIFQGTKRINRNTWNWNSTAIINLGAMSDSQVMLLCVCVLATTCANLFKSPWPPPHFAKSSSRRIAAFSRLCFAGIVLMIKWMACTETLYVLICFTWPWTVLSLATAWAGNMFMFENSPNIASRLPRAAIWLSMEAHTLLCCSLANRTDLILLTFLATIHGSYSGMCFAAWHGKSNCGKRLNWKCIIKLVKMAQAKANDYVLPSNLIEINATWQCCSCNDCKDWKLHIKRNTVTWSPAYHPSAIWEIRNLILPGIPHDSCPKKSEANDLGWKLWPSTKWNKTSPNQTRMKAPHWLHEAASQASCHPKAPQHSEWCRSEKQ